jgi:hypothetical protein
MAGGGIGAIVVVLLALYFILVSIRGRSCS